MKPDSYFASSRLSVPPQGGSRLRTPLGCVFGAQNAKSLHPLAQGRRLRRLRGTTLIRLGRHRRCPMPFIRPVTRARRNPLLGFHGFRLGGEFGKIWIGSHHPPILFPEGGNGPQLRPRIVQGLDVLNIHTPRLFTRCGLPFNFCFPRSLPTTPRRCRYHFCSTTDCSRFDCGCLPAAFANTTNMRSTGPSRAYPANITNSITWGHDATSTNARMPHTR